MTEEKAYILGADAEELHRLGLQHQVWASEAQNGWHTAQFNIGQTILDLGSGPGFCTKELAFLVGKKGKVIAVDRSAYYLQFIQEVAKMHQLNIETQLSDFDGMQLAPNSLDGMYCRWALAWVPNPKEILAKVVAALKPGGRMVIQEYYDWSTHQTEPSRPVLSKAIAAALRSFKESDGEIDIGRELPMILPELGMKVTNMRLMAKLATPQDANWEWPRSFYESYFPRLVPMNYLSTAEVEQALLELDELEQVQGATLYCPTLIEVVAEKV